MKKSAGLTTTPESTTKALELIKSRSNLSDKEINDYYRVAIKKEILGLGLRHLSKIYSAREIRGGLLNPIYEYYINPKLENIIPIANQLKHSRRPSNYISIINELSMKFSDEVNQRI